MEAQPIIKPQVFGHTRQTEGTTLYPPEQRVLDAALHQADVLTGDPNHTVAAAAMDTLGNIHTAVNDYHFTGGPCAELVVLGLAAARGAGPLTTMVAVGDGGRGVIAPCGRCRQVMLDQHPDCFVVVPTEQGESAVSIRDLLPYTYQHPDAAPERLLRFNPRYYDSVLQGTKRATTRHDDPAAAGPVWLVFEFDEGYKRVRATINSIEHKRFDELSDQDAQLEDCPTGDALREGLRSHYPEIASASPIQLVRFTVT